MPTARSYGSWRSPISADMVAQADRRLGELRMVGGDVYWVEGRPLEGGRSVVVRRWPEGRTADITPAGFNARTSVHEYGGGSFAVAGETVYFSNFQDGRLYRQTLAASPVPITPEGDLRYADACVDEARGRLICVREDHRQRALRDCENTLVAVDLDGSAEPRLLASGRDFYSNPRLSPDGSQLCWLCWDLPAMPWEGTELWVAGLDAQGVPSDARRVAGGAQDSIFQPEWSPQGVLHLVSDRTGWWNLYRHSGRDLEALCEMEAEFGDPQWLFGFRTYAFAGPDCVVCSYFREGDCRLATLTPSSGELHDLDTAGWAPDLQRYVDAGPGVAVMIAAAADRPTSVVSVDLAGGGVEVLATSSETPPPSGYLSRPRHLTFPTALGEQARCYFYPPSNADFSGPEGERPPLLVLVHGGPTSQAKVELDLTIQYFTSRGFAVADVDYRGSTGYGRAYRDRLRGNWGVCDLEDCTAAAQHLASSGLVDGARLIISGGSAGGYTTLWALTAGEGFATGASYYGLADLERFDQDTHRFESGYLGWLVPRELLRDRSPIHQADRLRRPMIIFQGLEDHVVPPSQAEIMVEALRRKGVPFAYLTFPGEGHGFRDSANIKRSLEAEIYFYSRILGFELADPVDPVEIENLL